MEYAEEETFSTVPRQALARLSSHWRKVFKDKCFLVNLFTTSLAFPIKLIIFATHSYYPKYQPLNLVFNDETMDGHDPAGVGLAVACASVRRQEERGGEGRSSLLVRAGLSHGAACAGAYGAGKAAAGNAGGSLAQLGWTRQAGDLYGMLRQVDGRHRSLAGLAR